MHYTAYSRRPNDLMVTGTFADADGRKWVRVQLPKRPNGSTAWLPASSVELRPLNRKLRVRLATRTVEVVENGVTVRRFKAAVGTGGTPTPVGRFAVQDPVNSSPSQRSYLGPRIITLTAFSPVLRTFMGGPGLIAIHGTSAPQLLGQAVSHGCIRVANQSVEQLWKLVTPGMPVEITKT
jgi:lipoprotein-anchoring transpeptidase ErfK/SrfK